MAGKQLIFHDEARDRIGRGGDALARAVALPDRFENTIASLPAETPTAPLPGAPD